MTKTKIAVFASGTGSNFESIANEIKAGTMDCEISMLVCDNPEAKVIAKATTFEIPTFVFNPKGYTNKELYETEIVEVLEQAEVEWIVLAGYMRLIGPTLLTEYNGRILNIHPSLLPAFPGKDAIGQALDAGVKVSGVTIHYVDEGMDTGEIIAQESLVLEDGEDRESLQERIQQMEHRLYPIVLQEVVQSFVNKEGKDIQ
ncbi:phosphoribosylglycinamide formyltransferase [Aquibacillus sp. 3ASR75-11]|uniref:Phosphoribosylglycinamide formyltransferase n=1 Tax=Terrihalobacillus insolitus TaxID=2950438 RepID=A0A9X3WT89_9BACI|nr:phosphoribosylglycinamide formyltransferase [Terrihalobacillus insolitus]MDC3414196.1 phosphoribosylglycinamide formyltransferase [Terrihalobacillus insolitus]MDC3425402.1 phosphoribosylglycinamide formyltransferase [Terrihalobacillus insolitus]